MRIAFVSLYGNFSPIAERIGQEIGFKNILFCYYYKDYSKWWDGILPKPDFKYDRRGAKNILNTVYSFRPDFCIFDMTGEGTLADEFREARIPVIGSCEFCDFLELNRFYGEKIIKSLGFNTPGSVYIQEYSEAIRFIKSRKDQDERWVIKFNDNQGNFSSYVSTDCSDMLEELEHFNEANRVDFTRGAIIQEFIEGIEVSCEGWFDGDNWVEDGFNYTMEEKKFLTGNLGPSTGCEGNLVWKAKSNEKIPKQFSRLSPLLRRFSYVGPFDVNNIIATENHKYKGFPEIIKGINYVLEPTPRFGYDAIYTLLEGYKGLISNLFAGLITQSLTSIDISTDALMGLRVSIPPYPFNDISQTHDRVIEKLSRATLRYMLKSTEGTIVRIRDLHSLKHIWLQDIRIEEKKQRLIVNGTDSVIAVVTAKDQNLNQARKRVELLAKSLDIPNPQYRLDVGMRAFKEIPQLVELKILQEPEFSLSLDQPSKPEKIVLLDAGKTASPQEDLELYDFSSDETPLPSDNGDKESHIVHSE